MKQVKPNYNDYKLVWSDEFKRDGRPEPANWIFEEGLVRNNEAQFYQPENATVRGGKLIIETRREQRRNPKYQPGASKWPENCEFAEFTSSCLMTRGKHAWQFGRFEMRAKIDTRLGIWPAFWTLGVDGEWPDNGEIDIMEFYRGGLLANVAWGTNRRWNAKWDSSKKPIETFSDPKWSEKFHKWRMDWDRDFIRLFVDDFLLNETDLSQTINPSNGKNPFHQPHYILVNTAVGGQNGGDPSQTTFPSRFEVDYIRVYQKK
jgi:beta-glucanase (GH16 family)